MANILVVDDNESDRQFKPLKPEELIAAVEHAPQKRHEGLWNRGVRR